MSEVDLSDDYANAKYISNAKSFPEKWQKKSANFRNERALFSNVELDIPYGPSDREKMDIFYPEKKSIGVFVFIHGGYWRAFDKSSWSHLSLGALSERVQHEKTGLIAKNIKQFGDYILEIYSNNELWTDIRNNLKTLRGNKNWSYETKKFLDVLEINE